MVLIQINLIVCTANQIWQHITTTHAACAIAAPDYDNGQSSDIKYLSSQTKFGQTNLLYIINGMNVRTILSLYY